MSDEVAFIAISYSLTENEPFVLPEKWSDIYGTLESGRYRYCTEMMDFLKAGDYDRNMYYAYFTI